MQQFSMDLRSTFYVWCEITCKSKKSATNTLKNGQTTSQVLCTTNEHGQNLRTGENEDTLHGSWQLPLRSYTLSEELPKAKHFCFWEQAVSLGYGSS